jgi:hypothetical protein
VLGQGDELGLLSCHRGLLVSVSVAGRDPSLASVCPTRNLPHPFHLKVTFCQEEVASWCWRMNSLDSVKNSGSRWPVVPSFVPKNLTHATAIRFVHPNLRVYLHYDLLSIVRFLESERAMKQSKLLSAF